MWKSHQWNEKEPIEELTTFAYHSLALAEMKTLLRDVYSEFSTTPHVSMTEEAMVMSDQLISSRPVGGHCLLHFHPLERGDAAAAV